MQTKDEVNLVGSVQGHHPFRTRKLLVFSAFGIALGIATFVWTPQSEFEVNPFFVFFLYAGLVTLFDSVLTYGVKIKSSAGAVVEALARIDGVTPEELDHYYTSRTKIRMLSFLVGLTSCPLTFLLEFQPWKIFVCIYVLTTLGGILKFRVSGFKTPKLLHVYPVVPNQKSKLSGGQTLSHNMANKSLNRSITGSDIGPYYVGRIKL